MTVLKMYDGKEYIPCYTAPKGTTKQIGDVQLTNERSTDETKAATPKAVQAGLSPLEFKFSGASSDKSTGYFTQQSKDGVVNGWTYNGTIPLANIPNLTIDKIPKSAQERLYVAANKDAMYKLTTDNVQAGDTVKDSNTGILYYVKKDPDGKITSSNFTDYYEVYSAGKAAEADCAAKATNDGNGNNIANTYATKSSIGNAKITITQNDTVMKSFTTNQSGNDVKIDLKDTTYSMATQTASGLMSASDKKKLDGIANNANNYTYTLPTASASTLGGVKIGSNITIDSNGKISGTPNTDTQYKIIRGHNTEELYNDPGRLYLVPGDYEGSSSVNIFTTATTSSSGLMSSTDKTALDFIKKGYYGFSTYDPKVPNTEKGEKDDSESNHGTSVGSGGNFLASVTVPAGSYFIMGSATITDMGTDLGGGFHVGLSYYPIIYDPATQVSTSDKQSIEGITSALSPTTTDTGQKYNGYASACAVAFKTFKKSSRLVLSGKTGEGHSGYLRKNLRFDLTVDGISHTLNGPAAYIIAIPINTAEEN